jgi:hypothetical protein
VCIELGSQAGETLGWQPEKSAEDFLPPTVGFKADRFIRLPGDGLS